MVLSILQQYATQEVHLYILVKHYTIPGELRETFYFITDSITEKSMSSTYSRTISMTHICD